MISRLLSLLFAWLRPRPAVHASVAPEPMEVNQAGIALIQSFESCRLTAYPDGNTPPIWTIGWGHTLGVTEGMTCTQAQADQWFQEDVTSTAKIVQGLVPQTLNSNQFSACVSLAYNIGGDRFATSTLLRLLRQSNFQAASEQFPRWDKIDNVPDAGLLRRRQAEQQLFNTPI